MKITMVDLHGQYERIREEINNAIQEVLDTTAFINGPQVKTFAQHLAEYNQVEHVVPCANGTDALQIALMALGLQPGDEVIVPVHTYVATAEVIALYGWNLFSWIVSQTVSQLMLPRLKKKLPPARKQSFLFTCTANAQTWNRLWI